MTTGTLEIRMVIPTEFAEHIVKSHPGSELRGELMMVLGQCAVDATVAALVERAPE